MKKESPQRATLLQDLVRGHANVAFTGSVVARVFELMDGGRAEFAEKLAEIATQLGRSGVDPREIDNVMLESHLPDDEWKTELKGELVSIANISRAAAENRARMAPLI